MRIVKEVRNELLTRSKQTRKRFLRKWKKVVKGRHGLRRHYSRARRYLRIVRNIVKRVPVLSHGPHKIKVQTFIKRKGSKRILLRRIRKIHNLCKKMIDFLFINPQYRLLCLVADRRLSDYRKGIKALTSVKCGNTAAKAIPLHRKRRKAKTVKSDADSLLALRDFYQQQVEQISSNERDAYLYAGIRDVERSNPYQYEYHYEYDPYKYDDWY